MRHPLVEQLRRLRGKRKNFLIMTHDHPDPDAVASAWALSYLARNISGISSRIVYGGIIGRMENKLMVDLLHIPIRPMRVEDFNNLDDAALVDTQPPFQNNRFPNYRKAALVLDHHPAHPKTCAAWSLIDASAGATATILAEALLASGLRIPTPLATALVYGIGSETQNLAREAGVRDVAAYRTLFARANVKTLSKIQNPPRPRSFFQTLKRAIQRAFTMDRVVGVHLGAVPSQDIVAHMADFLLTHEDVQWSIVTGRYDGKLFVSLRTKNPRAEAGKLLWQLLGKGTSAGGHAMIAGGSIAIGVDAPESLWRQAEENLLKKFLAGLGYEGPMTLDYPYRRS